MEVIPQGTVHTPETAELQVGEPAMVSSCAETAKLIRNRNSVKKMDFLI
jgi:hypothetical protein